MLGRQRPFSPSVPAEAGCLFTVAAGVHVFISGESLHCFLVGWCTNKIYRLPTPLPYIEVVKKSQAAEASDPSGGRPNVCQGSTSRSVPGTVLALGNEEQS